MNNGSDQATRMQVSRKSKKNIFKNKTMNEGISGVPGRKPRKWFIDFSVAHPGSVNCTCGGFLLQNCVGESECEWGRSHLYYFPDPQFSISPSWAPLAEELSVYIQDIGNPISHNWDIFILYRQFTQLKHTHANGKVLQRYVLQSCIAPTLNCFCGHTISSLFSLFILTFIFLQ